jgi:hypothetical protein
MTRTPAPPAYIPFRLDAAPMKFSGTDTVALADAEVTIAEVVPTEAGVVYDVVVLFLA